MAQSARKGGASLFITSGRERDPAVIFVHDADGRSALCHENLGLRNYGKCSHTQEGKNCGNLIHVALPLANQIANAASIPFISHW
jgi:hypothetical protein